MTDSRVQAEQIVREHTPFTRQFREQWCDELIDAIASALAAAAPQWQLIETAPKDGTRVLLYGETSGGWKAMVDGSWNRGGAMHMPPHWMGGITRPTHWMPLPSLPPQEETGR